MSSFHPASPPILYHHSIRLPPHRPHSLPTLPRHFTRSIIPHYFSFLRKTLIFIVLLSNHAHPRHTSSSSSHRPLLPSTSSFLAVRFGLWWFILSPYARPIHAPCPSTSSLHSHFIHTAIPLSSSVLISSHVASLSPYFFPCVPPTPLMVVVLIGTWPLSMAISTCPELCAHRSFDPMNHYHHH